MELTESELKILEPAKKLALAICRQANSLEESVHILVAFRGEDLKNALPLLFIACYWLDKEVDSGTK